MKEPSTHWNNVCKSCNVGRLKVFHRVRSIPTNSCILLSSKEEALNYPRGDMELGFCSNCGFVSNVAYESRWTEYSGRYEETQAFSPTFDSFQRDLAKRLIERHNLHGKKIVEIGCGKGEFLTLLCEMGRNHGIGFDPAYVSERDQSPLADRVTFIKDYYSEKYAHYSGDFICCKMTLEHICDPFDFVSKIRRSIGDQLDTIAFFQVPDVTRILKRCAFEDIYYEHCSYFSPGSLSRLFGSCGFTVLHLATVYGGQYLLLEAKPNGGGMQRALRLGKDIGTLARLTEEFEVKFQKAVDAWKSRMDEMKTDGKRTVLWGSGSKAVSFLTTLGIKEEISYVVDINHHKQSFYMPGIEQQIVAPGFLKEFRPDVVIVMNRIYRDEIQKDLGNMRLYPDIMTL